MAKRSGKRGAGAKSRPPRSKSKLSKARGKVPWASAVPRGLSGPSRGGGRS